MKRLSYIFIILAATLAVLTGCSDSGSDGPAADISVLHLRIRLGSTSRSRAAGDEYEPDKLPASDSEKMQSLRIIILDKNLRVEHNTLWDLSSAPDVTFVGQDYPVRANEEKKIILVANEAGVGLTLPDGSVMSASDYFRNIDASIGKAVDLTELHQLTMEGGAGGIAVPLPMSAIHSYTIGKAQSYSATFYIHRAAVKYTFRFTNADTRSVRRITSVAVNHVASRLFFFPDADFTDTDQLFWSAYRTPAGTSVSDASWEQATDVAPGETAEIGPFYLPEGLSGLTEDPYAIAFSIDGRESGWFDLNWSIPQTPEQTEPMTDLPRNTHVIVNVKLLPDKPFLINYTICPWNEKTIDIPAFN